MYNEDQKLRFIDQECSNETTAKLFKKWLFELKTERFEMQFGKDVYDFLLEDIIYMYKLLNISNNSTLRTINTMLVQYAKWALKEGLVKSNQNTFMLIDNDLLASCLNRTSFNIKFVSRKDLLFNLKTLENPRDQFILLALFEYGKANNYLDIGMQSLDSIDFDNHTMKLYSGRTVNISRELEEYAISSSNEKEYFLEVNSVNSKDGIFVRKLFDNGTIIKSVSPDMHNQQKISRNTYHNADRALDRIGMNHCTPGDLVESGKIHFIKEEMETLGINDLQEYLFTEGARERIEHQFGCGKIIVKRFVTLYGGLI